MSEKVMKKLILLELNEVRFKILDHYCSSKPRSFLNKLLSNSRQYQTHTTDKIQLDPWISWPTFHRGVSDELHGVLHLGQVTDETDQAYPPIWQMLKNKGHRVGVFGSLHSSTVPGDADLYSFYVPDYFDDKVYANPASLKPFQELNLAMTRQSARNVTLKMPLSLIPKSAWSAFANGLSLNTLADVGRQLVDEVFDRGKRIRRRTYQPLVMADLFLHQLEKTKPDFATFYTNHVAAAMHRYWGATFPEDYGDKPMPREWIRRYKDEIMFAMDKLDVILKKLAHFVDANPEYTLVIASSLGQAAIPAMQTQQFLTVTEPTKFMSALGLENNQWQLKPAMVPCLCVVVEESRREAFLKKLRATELDGRQMLESPKPVQPLSFDERERGFFQIFIQDDTYAGSGQFIIDGKKLLLEEAGLGFVEHEDGVNCTAQHITEGSLIVYGKSVANHGHDIQRFKVPTIDFVPSVLAAFGHDQPAYMKGSASIQL